ncbi:MAG: ABC transporter ATP-binding protein [Acidimicrobiales bacterium]
MALVTARGVAKSYGGHVALSGVDFDIEPGITGLLGANGAGKTTMLGMIIGLHPRDSGTLEVLGHDPWSDGVTVRERLGYAPEHHTLPPDVRAADFVRHVAELHGIPKAEATTRASDALWLVELGEERFRPMGTMSTGQRQRVKLAQAIAHDPGLVLLDEPTDGLDPVQRDVMLDLIKSVSTEYGINVILSSHLLAEVERICTGVVIIGDGRTIASGPIDQLRDPAARAVVVELDATEAEVEAVAADLRAAGVTVERDRRRLTMAGDDPATYDRVVAVAVARQVGIIRLGSSVSTLEDVFLGATG